MKRSALLSLAAIFLGVVMHTAGAQSSSVLKSGSYDDVVVTVSPTDEDFPNPERGFYMPAGYESRLHLDHLRIDRLTDLAGQGYRLVLVLGYLGDYRNKDIPDDYLENIQNGFEILRQTGLKAILRFAYIWGVGDSPEALLTRPDASLQRMRRHISQLAPIMKQNADVIAVLQAGFIGPWGEWHSSTHGVDDLDSEKIVLDDLLEALPESRQVQIRPPYTLWYHHRKPPTIEDKFSESPSPLTRIGVHNDCFLSDSNDYDTYPSIFPPGPDALRAYVMKVTDVTSFGAETCVPRGRSRMTCSDIMQEGRDYHMTYLNGHDYKDFLDGWKAQGCFEDIGKNLGYRLRLKRFHINWSDSDESEVDWKIELANDGWARPMNPRPLVLRFQNPLTGATADRDLPRADLRRASPGADTELSGSLRLPVGLRPGSYKVLLGAPDPALALAADPRYSIRFANADQPSEGQAWSSETGFMDLGISVEVR